MTAEVDSLVVLSPVLDVDNVLSGVDVEWDQEVCILFKRHFLVLDGLSSSIGDSTRSEFRKEPVDVCSSVSGIESILKSRILSKDVSEGFSCVCSCSSRSVL